MGHRFSIIIPVYNVAPYLRECLDSVLNQTFADWEAICVDDGSTDGSGLILDEYAEKDKRIKVIHQKNAGVSVARNVALDVAVGEWIGFLDSDDVLAPWAFNKVANASKVDSAIDVVGFNTKTFKGDEGLQFNEIDDRCLISPIKILTMNEAGHAFWCKFYRRDVVGNTRFQNYKIGEDTLFLISVMLNASKFAKINDVCHGYRLREASVFHQKVSKVIVYSHPKLMDEFIMIANNNSNRISSDLKRYWINSATEMFFWQLFLLDIKDRREGFEIWKTKSIKWSSCSGFSLKQRFRLMVFRSLPFFFVACVLFYVPAWLKVKGFHR